MPKEILRVGVLASGSGSNLQSIIDNIEQGKLRNVEIVCVISNNAGAFALERAQKHGIPAMCIDHRHFQNREVYDQALVEKLHEYGVGLVVLAGFIRIITPVLLVSFPNAVMNIHPALLPNFPGLHAQRQALEYGVKVTGCTVHFVDAGTDTGPIIIQKQVTVFENDTEETLSIRILSQEHRAYPEAIGLFAAGRLKLKGRTVTVLSLPEELSTETAEVAKVASASPVNTEEFAHYVHS